MESLIFDNDMCMSCGASVEPENDIETVCDECKAAWNEYLTIYKELKNEKCASKNN